jgi:hypothetical protein
MLALAPTRTPDARAGGVFFSLVKSAFAKWGFDGDTNSVCSPPPCGEGLGVGVVIVDASSCNNNHPPPSPPPQGGREHTEFVSPAFPNPTQSRSNNLFEAP